jgi:hypothetical protein
MSRPASSKEAANLARLLAEAGRTLKFAWSPRALAFNELCTIEINSAYQAPASTPTALAERFLTAWPLDLPTPEIGVDPDGEISFDWFGGKGRNFSVSLREDGRIAYAGAFGGAKTKYGTDRFDDAIPSEIVEAVRELRGKV